MNKERLLWLDQARGFCILLVLLGHITIIPSSLWALIYTFHMPFFFVVSGFLWDDVILDKYNFKTYCSRKFKGLIIPYFKIAFVCMVIWGIITPPLYNDHLNISSYLLQIWRYTYGIIYSLGNVEYMPNCSPIWFLTSFFCSNIFFYLCRIIGVKYGLRQSVGLSLLVFVLIGYIGTLIPRLPWNINSAFIGCYFMTIGYIIKESGIYRSIRCAVLFSVILFLFYIIKSDIPIVNMAINNYENYWLTILVSPVTCLIIIHFFYGLSKFLIKFKVFEYASINSIGFFGYDYSTKIIGSLPVIGAYWFVFWILKVIILTLFIKVINRFNLRKYFY